MTTSNILNIVGLCFDIAGVILLFFYEPPKEDFSVQYEGAPSQEKQDKIFQKKRRLSKLALRLLIAGFIVQIISNVLPICSK